MRRLTVLGLSFLLGVLLLGAGNPANHAAGAASTTVRAAFYYPWFPETWGDGTHYAPTLGRYDSASPAVIAAHIQQMQQAKIQAGIASWWGPGTPTDDRFPALLSGAAGTGFKWTAYYETEGYSNPSSTAIASDLAYLGRYTSSSAWLQVNGKPVLFVYGDGSDGCGMVDRWTTANAGRFYLVLKVFPGYLSCGHQPDSWHQYAPAAATDAQLPFSYSVSPGFWKANESQPRLARDPTAFATDVRSMVASGAQFQLITTFNEWGEGSAIESEAGWKSTYLTILQNDGATATTGGPKHPLVVIYMENHERSDITTGPAPYMNALRGRGIDFTHYYGVAHPSLPNYLALANGSTDGKVGTDSIRAGELPQSPTLWNQLSTAGVSWNVYEEGMPSVCSSATTSGRYALKHNPATPFAAVFNNSSVCSHVKPYTPGVPLARMNFIAPDLCNDMHDCSIQTGDTWLKNNVEPMIAAGAKVVLTFDEGDTGTNGGGNIYTVVVGGANLTPRVLTGTYNHYSLLAAIEKKFGLTRLGAAASASVLPLS